MFSPGTKRRNLSSRKESRNVVTRHNLNHTTTTTTSESPITPILSNRKSLHRDSIPDRPTTGTPAPWAPSLSLLARVSQANKGGGDTTDATKPVFLGDFPQELRDQQATCLQRRLTGNGFISGGIDKETCLSWIICGNRLFIWNYLSSPASKKCTILEIPSSLSENGIAFKSSYYTSRWLLCLVDWAGKDNVLHHKNSVGVILCNQITRAVAYWPDIFGEAGRAPVTSFADSDGSSNRQQQHSGLENSSTHLSPLNSLIATSVPNSKHVCVAFSCSSNGELWQFYCNLTGIQCKRIYEDILSLSSQESENIKSGKSLGYPRSLIWRSVQMEESDREFFLLTDHEIVCFTLKLQPSINVSKHWSHEIVGNDGDLGIQKDLAGQKRIWPLDLQIDEHGKVITVLVATFCKDRVSGSSYTQYSLLTMQYKSGVNITLGGPVLEKKAPIQVIIPKARVEDEEFLFSMRLRVGGKPLGSAVIVSGDGTATVSHYWRNSTRLYQFDLPYDSGIVLDASILPPTSDGEEGAWVVLTEKAGIWAIPEQAVVIGGVEPPERSLSRKGSSNDESTQEKRNLSFAGNIVPRRASSEAWDVGDRQRAVVTGVARRTAQDEESEALLSNCFNHFLSSGEVDSSLNKLLDSGAFERDGETNVFARVSKSIVDTLAKHWTTTRGAEIVSMGVVSSQLKEKQQKHEKFLQFLAITKCHEELCSSRQRHSLQIIMEHGEKVSGMIQLRELQNIISQKRATAAGSHLFTSDSRISGALWDLIQLVGEKARRNTVLLMDRDNAEVFYSKVSDLEEIFHCLDKQLQYIISEEQPVGIQIQRVSELSHACVDVIRTAIHYKTEHNMWYPPPEGLTPWYCQVVVRNGLWRIASFMLRLSKEVSQLDTQGRSSLYTHLEELAEILLEACNGAITAKVERGEDPKGLLEEYWNRRDEILDSLYQQVKGFVESQNLHKDVPEQIEERLRKLSSNLLTIAKQHEGYKTMWEICCDLNDSVLLRNLMHDSMGPRGGGFSNFVFRQLYEKKQYSKLLRLGEEFPEELSSFLKPHQNLLWLHEVLVNQFTSASETLHVLGLSQDTVSISADEQSDSMANSEPTLADRRRFLNLSKLAAMAGMSTSSLIFTLLILSGKNAGYEVQVKRIEFDIKLLNLQEEVVPSDSEATQYNHQLLSPVELIKLCLEDESPELALRAFDVFAWTSSSFWKTHQNLLEECWRNAANQDDWEQLYQASVSEGWSEEETLSQLKHTLLFQASNKCYGIHAETFDGSFDEVLPLRRENPEDVSVLNYSSSSVEAILMQHKDFPDAGKLMLSAIMLGCVQEDDILEGPMLME
ncbi:hypothetical protein ACFE04_017334 [Oxalis oulophora]